MRRILIPMIVVSLLALSVLAARAEEEGIEFDDLPQNVARSIQNRFPDLKVKSISKETDDKGQIVYDIELKQRDRKFECDIRADGTMLEIEKEVLKNSWPKALRATIRDKYPDASIEEVLEVNKVSAGQKEIPDHLEVTIQTDAQKSVEVLLTLDGKRITKESHGETTSSSDETSSSAEKEVEPDDLPQTIRDGLHKRFSKAKIVSAEKGKEDGQFIYEVSIKSNGHSIDVSLSPKGEILSYEKTLLPTERPKRMMETLSAKYPQASIKRVEEVWEHDKRTGYEGTIISPDKKTIEVDFDANGKLIVHDKQS